MMKRRRLALPLLLTLGAALTACNPAATLNRTTSLSGLSVTRNLPYGPDARNVLDLYAPQSCRRPGFRGPAGGAVHSWRLVDQRQQR